MINFPLLKVVTKIFDFDQIRGQIITGNKLSYLPLLMPLLSCCQKFSAVIISIQSELSNLKKTLFLPRTL